MLLVQGPHFENYCPRQWGGGGGNQIMPFLVLEIPELVPRQDLTSEAVGPKYDQGGVTSPRWVLINPGIPGLC